MKRSPSRYTTVPTRDKILHRKTKICQCILLSKLSAAVVKVDIKVTKASLTQNQCLQITMCKVALNACWVTATERRHWTEQWRHDHVGQSYQTELNFFLTIFNQRRPQFMFAYSFSNWLEVSCFSFRKTVVKCQSSSVNGIFDDVRYDVISTEWCCHVGLTFLIF